MSITSVVNDLVTSVSVINALKPLPPTISGYSVGGVDDTALDPAGGQTVQRNGTGFLPGATITFDGSAVAVVTYVSPNRLTFTSPAKSAGTYTIYAVNPDGGTAIFIPGIIYSVLPTWTTSAGTLGSYYETTSISNTVVASGDAPITYSLFSGSLPTGSTLYANGVITGTAPIDSSSTTYSFTIQATDAQLQDSTRSFSLTINTDAVTWVSPANNTTYTSAVDSAIANVTLSATDAAGYAVSYSANALPTGLSLSGANISGTPTVIADSSTLLTATAATTNRTAVRTINWSITVANDPYFEYNTLLIPGASTTFVDDASTNNFAVTINGDTKPNSFNPYTPGYYSNYFDGLGDWLTIPNNTGFAFGSGAFTVEMWVNISGSSGTVANYSNGQSSNSNFSWELYQVSSTTIQFSVLEGATQYSSSSASFSLNKWNHIACVRNGNTLTIYVNGVAGGTTANLTGVTVTEPAGSTLKLCSYGNGSDYVTGYISNFRVVKGTAVYTTTFTPSTTPLTAISGTSLLTCQSNRFIDNSTNNFTLTVYGNTSISAFDPFVPNTSYSTYGSGYFDGTGDYLLIPSSSNLAFDTGDFCVEMWYYQPTIALAALISNSVQSGSAPLYGDAQFEIQISASTYYPTVYGWSTAFLTSSVASPAGRWNHIAVCRNGTTASMFLNGVRVATATVTNNFSSTNSFNIGRQATNSGYLIGYISNLRISKGSSIYDPTSSSITIPTAPLTAIANTSLLTLQNNQSVNNSTFLDNSTNNFLVTRAGNATQGTFSPYGGNWSNYFDGAGDNLSISTSTAFGYGTGDFTIEFWTLWGGTLNSLNGGTFIEHRSAVLAEATVIYLSTSGVIIFYDGPANVEVNSGITITQQWTHIALTRASGVWRLFVNGSLAGSRTSSSDLGSTKPCLIGQAQNGTTTSYNGYISNVRIVKGTALYTANFTPSTTPLTAISGTSLLTCQSNRIVDNSINNFTITKGGDTSVQRFSPFNPSSVTPTSYSGYFDGTGDYLTVPSNSAFAFGTGDFTIECWVNTPLVHAYNDVIIELRSTESTSTGFVFNMNPTGIGYQLNFYTDGGFNLGSTVLNYNVWNHCAVTRSGTTVRLFSNGVLNGTFTKANNFSDTPVPHIGVSPLYSPSDVIGYFSNLRVIKGTALYTTTFTPSTTPLTTTSQGATASQVSLLTLQSPTFIDNSTNNFTITAFGNSQPRQQNPFGYTSTTTNGYTPSTIGGSGYFDGTGDYLSYTGSLSLTGAFTVQGWFYNTSTSGAQQTLFSFNSTSGSYASIRADCDNGNTQYKFAVNCSTGATSWNLDLSTNNAFVKNIWNHFAVTRDSANLVRVFINGVQIASGTQAGTLYNTSTTHAIGCNGLPGAATNPFIGYISDLQLINGTALYTSNFVPPSAPLTAVQNTVLLTNMTSAGIYDASMMNNMETVGGAKLSTAVTKFGGSSVDLTSGATLTLKPNLYFANNTDFTIEGWINITSFGTNNMLMGWNTANFDYVLISSAGIGLNQQNTYTANWSVSLSSGTWFHLAITRSSGVCRCFVNGIKRGSDITNTNNLGGNVATQIGNWYTSPSYPFNGYLDDFRITMGYARYTSNFTPPTSALQIK